MRPPFDIFVAQAGGGLPVFATKNLVKLPLILGDKIGLGEEGDLL